MFDTPKFCISIVFSFSCSHFNSQEKLKTMLMQNFVVTNKEHYGMLWLYFLEWSIIYSILDNRQCQAYTRHSYLKRYLKTQINYFIWTGLLSQEKCRMGLEGFPIQKLIVWFSVPKLSENLRSPFFNVSMLTRIRSCHLRWRSRL